MTSIIKEFLNNNPYFVLSFLISLYFVSCYVICNKAIYGAIENIKNKNNENDLMTWPQILLELLWIIIVNEILNINIYLEILIGATLHSIIFVIMSVIVFLCLPRDVKNSIIPEELDNIN
jgi:hypothetical protein